MKYEIELKRIKNFVEKYAGYDISTKLRDAETVKYRTLYFKIASDTTKYTLSQIGKIVNRDHATVLHARKNLFNEFMDIKNFAYIYNQYKINILGKKVDNEYKNIQQYNKLKEKYNDLLAVKIPVNNVINLTENENIYRTLSDQDKKIYDERAALVLKSFEWKRKDAQRKEVFDIIIGEPTVENSRGTLR